MEFIKKLYRYIDLDLESSLVFELMDRELFCYLEEERSPEEIQDYLHLEKGGEALGEALESQGYVEKTDTRYESS